MKKQGLFRVLLIAAFVAVLVCAQGIAFATGTVDYQAICQRAATAKSLMKVGPVTVTKDDYYFPVSYREDNVLYDISFVATETKSDQTLDFTFIMALNPFLPETSISPSN